ncbi:hypothetical protein [Aquirufa aurantiipilula]
MKTKNSEFVSLDQFIESNYGNSDNNSRDQFESGYQHFKLGFLLHEARKIRD